MIASLFPQWCSKGYFRRAQGVGSNGHNLPVDADEQLRPLELLGVLLDYAGEGGARNYLATELLIGCPYSLI